MNPSQPNKTISGKEGLLWALGAAISFHLAYSFQALNFAILLFLHCLFQLSHLNTTRKSFYIGLALGFAIYGPHLSFFLTLFGRAAIALWLVLAFWLALFLLMANSATKRFGSLTAALLLPFLWTGLEYFRSELYYLRFSWLNTGFVFQSHFSSWFGFLGVYGIGLILAGIASFATNLSRRRAIITLTIAALFIAVLENLPTSSSATDEKTISIAGVQMEFPDEPDVLKALDTLIRHYPSARLLVLSEYTFMGPIPEAVKLWCKANERYLIVGGKEVAGANFYNTAFVIGPGGEIEFKQGKSVPIQFFADGLPAREQKLWNSPWGKIGLCVCYDLSYRRVVDELVRQGAQAIIVPTMDVMSWGERQHKLHGRVAPIRAAEFAIPFFRVCSSGISQFVDRNGFVAASAPFPGENKMLGGKLELGRKGRLPLDHWLAPVSVFITILTALALIIKVLRRGPKVIKN